MISFSSKNNDSLIRRGTVETSIKTFKTPTAALTNSEFQNFKDLRGPDTPLPVLKHPVVETRQEWEQDTVERLRESGYWERRRKDAKLMMQEYPRKLHFYRPRVNDAREDGELSREHAERIMTFAINADFDWIPFIESSPDCSPREFKEQLLEALELMEQTSDEKDLIPFLSIKTEADDLLEKMEIAANLGCDALAMDVRAVKTHADRLSAVMNFAGTERGKKTLLYAANAPRTKPLGETKISIRQILPVAKFDIVGYCKYPPYSGDRDVKEMPWLNHFTGTYSSLKSILDRTDYPACENPCCKGEHVSEIYFSYCAHGKMEEKVWLHDAVSLRREMARLREAEDSETIEAYYRERPELLNYCRKKLALDLV